MSINITFTWLNSSENYKNSYIFTLKKSLKNSCTVRLPVRQDWNWKVFPNIWRNCFGNVQKKWDIFHRRQNKGFVLKAVHFLLTLWFSKDNMYESPLPLHTQSLHILCGYNHTYICVLTPNDVRACVSGTVSRQEDHFQPAGDHILTCSYWCIHTDAFTLMCLRRIGVNFFWFRLRFFWTEQTWTADTASFSW